MAEGEKMMNQCCSFKALSGFSGNVGGLCSVKHHDRLIGLEGVEEPRTMSRKGHRGLDRNQVQAGGY